MEEVDRAQARTSSESPLTIIRLPLSNSASRKVGWRDSWHRDNFSSQETESLTEALHLAIAIIRLPLSNSARHKVGRRGSWHRDNFSSQESEPLTEALHLAIGLGNATVSDIKFNPTLPTRR